MFNSTDWISDILECVAKYNDMKSVAECIEKWFFVIILAEVTI